MSKHRNDFCATCGRQRKPLEQRRDTWRFSTTPIIPRIEGLQPWQITNDLIVSTCIYRNGGTSEDCHLCDDCLRIGLRCIKVEVDSALDTIEPEASKDAELVDLTEQLGSAQHQLSNLKNDLKNLRKIVSCIDHKVVEKARDKAFSS